MNKFSLSIFVSTVATLIAFGLSAAAQDMAYPTANEVSYTLQTSTAEGDRIYYSCDSVRRDVKKILMHLGAEEINVRCTGGIQYRWPALPAHVTASFVVASTVKNNASPRKAGYRTVRLRDESCQVIEESLTALSQVMEMDIISAPSYCRTNSRIRYSFDVRVLAFE